MKIEIKIVLFLLFLPPMLGELVTGSSPPLEFFNPILFIILVLLYGCGTLLIREAKARWNLQWSVIFLGVAYGVLEEGTIVQSFFNVSHVDLGALSEYGMFWGVQWPWTISLVLLHGTLSTLIPIAISELIWPEYKNQPLLKKRGLFFTSVGLILIVVFWMVVVIGQKTEAMYENYTPDIILVMGSILVLFLLFWLAYKYKDSRFVFGKCRVFPPLVFGIAGFLFQAVNVLLPNVLAESFVASSVTVYSQVFLVVIVLTFIFCQVYNRSVTKRHIVSLIFGSVFFWILISPITEHNINGAFGLSFVGIIALIMLIAFRRRALKT